MMLSTSSWLVLLAGVCGRALASDCKTPTVWNNMTSLIKPFQVEQRCYFAIFKPMNLSRAHEFCMKVKMSIPIWDNLKDLNESMLQASAMHPKHIISQSYHNPVTLSNFTDIPVINVTNAAVRKDFAQPNSKHFFVCKQRQVDPIHKAANTEGAANKTTNVVIVTLATTGAMIVIAFAFVVFQIIRMKQKRDQFSKKSLSSRSFKQVPDPPSSYLSPEEISFILMEQDSPKAPLHLPSQRQGSKDSNTVGSKNDRDQVPTESLPMDKEPSKLLYDSTLTLDEDKSITARLCPSCNQTNPVSTTSSNFSFSSIPSSSP